MPLKQKTLFGTTAKSQTYYKKKAETTFEKFIEAKWYFNNGGKRDQFYKAATKEWNEIKKDENAVSAIIEKHLNAIKGEEKEDLSKFESIEGNKGSKRTACDADVATTSKAPSSTTSPVNLPTTEIEHFLNSLKSGLSSNFTGAIQDQKLVHKAVDKLAKSYLAIHPDLVFYRDNVVFKRESALATTLSKLDEKINALIKVVEEMKSIDVKSLIGLSTLQINLQNKIEKCNEIAILSMELESFISEKNLKSNIRRRVAQIKQRNACSVSEDANLEKIKFFCKNNFSLTWDVGLKNLQDRLENRLPECIELKASRIMHIASLLEFSSIVTLEELGCSNSVATLLVHQLPIYTVTVNKKTVIVNFYQTSDTSDLLDVYFELYEEENCEEQCGKKAKRKFETVNLKSSKFSFHTVLTFFSIVLQKNIRI